MATAVMPMENPDSPLFTMSCHSNHLILLPPDKSLLLHVTSDGYREWDESLHLAPGSRVDIGFTA
jgi:hypothetical protein